ncbi:unnamed protein product [Euphydryas editha]|uniref:Uncharacterized protein n=1 Tax=Euphydryas editha TaxID=104508 RepID=A0AAU9TFP2_EUPED|nr:unnamed protein product [Euphydryas editha]
MFIGFNKTAKQKIPEAAQLSCIIIQVHKSNLFTKVNTLWPDLYRRQEIQLHQLTRVHALLCLDHVKHSQDIPLYRVHVKVNMEYII